MLDFGSQQLGEKLRERRVLLGEAHDRVPPRAESDCEATKTSPSRRVRGFTDPALSRGERWLRAAWRPNKRGHRVAYFSTRGVTGPPAYDTNTRLPSAFAQLRHARLPGSCGEALTPVTLPPRSPCSIRHVPTLSTCRPASVGSVSTREQPWRILASTRSVTSITPAPRA
jgi:hypothetical protein